MREHSEIAEAIITTESMKDYYVCDGGRIEHIVGGHITNPMIFDFYDVECCTRGEIYLHVNKKIYCLTEGDLYIIPPQTVYYKEFSAESSAASFLCVRGRTFDRYMNTIGISSQNVVFSHKLTPKAVSLLEETLNSLPVTSSLRINNTTGHRFVEHIQNKGYSDYEGIEANLRTASCLGLFLAELLRIYGKMASHVQPKSLQQEYIDSAVRFIEANYHLDISVQSIADHIGIDRSYLFTLFRKGLGISVQEYIIQHRIKVACDFLRQPDVSVKWVAASVGYETCSFSRVFKKMMGVSPTEYQQSCKKIGE